jgi:hypothetical protein
LILFPILFSGASFDTSAEKHRASAKLASSRTTSCATSRVSRHFRQGTPLAMPTRKGETPTMQKMPIAGSLFIAVVTSGCAARPMSTPPPLSSATSTTSSHTDHKYNAGHVYRLDFAVSANDAATSPAGPSGGTFTMNLEENRRGQITTGSNVALTPSGGARVDVGMKVKALFYMVGDDILLESDAELSSAESGAPGQPSTIRKISATGEALVSPGKPTLIASAEDPQGHSHYQLMVTATKLR